MRTLLALTILALLNASEATAAPRFCGKGVESCLFTYSGGNYTKLTFPSNVNIRDNAMNGDGQIIAGNILDNNGTFSTLPSAPFLGAANTYYNGFNDNGQFIGLYDDSHSQNLGGFVDRGGNFIDLNQSFPGLGPIVPVGISDSGTIVGFDNLGSFIDNNGVLTYFGKSVGFRPTGMSDSGLIIGVGAGAFAHTGYVYSGGTLTTLSDPGFSSVYPTAINGSGQVVGYLIGTHNRPNLLEGGFVETNGVYTRLQIPGSSGWAALPGGISDSGEVVGWYGGVPEPASWAMMLLGIGGIGGVMRARRRQAVAIA